MRAPGVSAGVMATACTKEGISSNTGSPVGGVYAPTENPRGPAWADRVAERPVVVRKPGNAGGAKGPRSRGTQEGGKDRWRLAKAY